MSAAFNPCCGYIHKVCAIPFYTQGNIPVFHTLSSGEEITHENPLFAVADQPALGNVTDDYSDLHGDADP
ncbi:hypothetical protein EJP81_05605 [Rahnella aquatilis]|nr:hypothetical protein D3Z09_05900 [Rahnella aquatilis]AZP41340.1 hypothetical protein EJP79_05600 [Rahnella aquatilis]AZP45681.1 hypothetical protein EJP81_05605 [Rahnella aquatilis]AZP50150.1 hypothetical protein EJP80_06355 [Rahnella aquatilis]